MSADRQICIAGAGSIGCFVGGVLAAAGRDVSLLARARLMTDIKVSGLRVTSFEGFDRHLETNDLAVSEDPSIFNTAGVILVTVKSGDTSEIARLIGQHAPVNAVIVSLQNGIGNVAVLRQLLPGRKVLAGMVPFNVIALDNARFHRTTSGDILIEQGDAETAALLSVPGLAMRPVDNIVGVQWGKLLLNLNNALNALSNLPLRDQLAQRAWRVLFADQMSEALAAMQVEGIHPVASTPLPAGLTPYLLRLPDFAFQLLLGRMMKIDPGARSSMWEDLQRGRRTEIDYLQGVIVQLSDRHGLAAPLSRRVVSLVRSAETTGKGSPGLTPEQVGEF
jgi:2-dehydropantoate 2-reductase